MSFFTILFPSFVIQSEVMNLFPSPSEIPHGVRNDKGTSKSIIHSGFQPSAEGLPCFPNAAHWAELTRPFRALTAVSRQLRIPPLKGGLGGCSYQRHDGRTQRFAPTRRTEMGMRPTAPHNNSIPQQFSSLFTIRFSLFTSLVIQSVSEESFPFRGGISHSVRNDKLIVNG